MTPMGHLSTAFLAGKAVNRVSMAAVIIGGLLPDGDYCMVFFPWFSQIHRVVTHNLLFVMLVAVVGSLFVSAGRRNAVLWGLLLGGLLHIFVDACMDTNPSNGIGVALWWPFLRSHFSPVNVVEPIQAYLGWGGSLPFVRGTLVNILVEIPFYVLAAVVFFRHRGYRQKKTPGES